MSNVIVVGGGLARLMATIKKAEAGTHVDLFSLVSVKRSHSVCAQGGVNGAVISREIQCYFLLDGNTEKPGDD